MQLFLKEKRWEKSLRAYRTLIIYMHLCEQPGHTILPQKKNLKKTPAGRLEMCLIKLK